MSPDAFAREWIDAWNAHDLERILSHYSDEIVFTSPVAAQLVPETLLFGPDGRVTTGFAAYPR